MMIWSLAQHLRSLWSGGFKGFTGQVAHFFKNRSSFGDSNLKAAANCMFELVP